MQPNKNAFMRQRAWKRRNILYFLKMGAHIDEHDTYDLTPLYVAISYGSEELAIRLIEMGADVNECNGAMYSPLHAAVIIGLKNVCELLIKRGASFWTSIHKAAYMGDLELLQKEYPLINTSEPIWKKAPPLFYAIGSNQLKVVQWLVERNPTEVHQKNLYGNTPLMCTTWSGNISIASYLLSSVSFKNEKSHSAMTPLLWASLHGKIEMVEFLIANGASLNESQTDGATPLQWAVKNGHISLVDHLITNYYSEAEKAIDSSVSSTNSNGNSTTSSSSSKKVALNYNHLIQAAVKEGEVEMVEYLIDKAIHLELDKEENLLHAAVKLEGHVDLVRLLLTKINFNKACIEEAITMAVDTQIKKCAEYYLSWPQLRLITIAFSDPASPFSVLPKELLRVILRAFQSC